MNNFRRQQLRGGFVTTITALLLVVSVAFSVIGYAASDGTKQQLEAVESRYTTIGVMRDQNAQPMIHDGIRVSDKGTYWVDKNYTRLGDGSILWNDGTTFYSSTVLEGMAVNAPQIRTVARSAILSAHVSGIYGLTSGTQKKTQFNEAFDKYSYNYAVFVGASETHGSPYYYEGAIRSFATNVFHSDGFKVFLSESNYLGSLKAVAVHPYYRSVLNSTDTLGYELGAPETIHDPYQDEYLYEKQYIVRAFIKAPPYVQIERKQGDQVLYVYRQLSEDDYELRKHFTGRDIIRDARFAYTTGELSQMTGIAEQEGEGPDNFVVNMTNVKRTLGEMELPTNMYYYTVPEDGLPFYAEFEGTLKDFLNSEEGQVWRDVIIPMAEINHQSATVMLVDDLDYLHAFNSGKAIIVDGRKIDASEFVRGDKVCVVSSAYADYAGLSVGDTLNLDFYDTGYFLTSAKIENWDATVSEFVMTHNPLQESNRIGYEEEYTIVGIYSAPEYEYGTTSFYADTIFIPKASVPNAEEYEDPSLPLLNSVVLMNGTTEEFEEYMESQGFGGYYTYFDQDYSSTISGLQALSQNALRLVILAAAVFFVTAILFYYLNFKRMIPVAYGMRRMGQHPFKLWWQMEMVTLPIILIAVFGGAYLGVYFFEYVTLELFETNIIMDIETVKWLTCLEAAALSAISLLVAIPISVPRLMKRK